MYRQYRTKSGSTSAQMQNAFTLTELIIVIVIIGILAAVIIPAVSSYVDKARDSSALQTSRQYSSALANYNIEIVAGSYTQDFETYCENLSLSSQFLIPLNIVFSGSVSGSDVRIAAGAISNTIDGFLLLVKNNRVVAYNHNNGQAFVFGLKKLEIINQQESLETPSIDSFKSLKDLISKIQDTDTVFDFQSILSGKISTETDLVGADLIYAPVSGGYSVIGVNELYTNKKVVIPSSEKGLPVVEIASGAFETTCSLKELIVPITVVKIGKASFSGLKELEKITIPFVGDSSGSYGSSVFGRIFYTGTIIAFQTVNSAVPASLASVIISGSTDIANNAFGYCSKIQNVEMSGEVRTIGSSAFIGCSNLVDVKFSDKLESIGSSAFEFCTKMKEVTIPKKVNSIGTRAFKGCSLLTEINVEKGSTTFSSSDGNLLSENGKTLIIYPYGKSIALIPDSVVEIDDYAFEYCKNITSISLSSKITKIGDNAFKECTSLVDVQLPGSLKTIGANAFYGCSSIPSINIPASVDSIGSNAFLGCVGVTSINVDNDNLMYSTVGGALLSKEQDMFIACPNGLSGDFVIPDTVTHILDQAFNNCVELRNITIPNSVNYIAVNVFGGCVNLFSIHIPDSVTFIGASAFTGCANLVTVTLPVSITEIGNDTFALCGKLVDIKLPDTLLKIGDYAFDSCLSLKSIFIPSSVLSIGFYAFNECKFLTIYTSVTTVPSKWSSWNPSNRPYFLGVRMAYDTNGAYVTSFTKNSTNLKNTSALNGIMDPYREGFTFVGWSIISDSVEVSYTSIDVKNAAEGTVLYAIWADK